MKNGHVSYWRVFRLIFVLFFLYLMRDAFYRWDGFKYYASFAEFVPSVALVTILWSIVAVFTALMVWLPGRALEWFSMRIGWKVRAEHWLLFLCIFVLSGATAKTGKQFIWPDTHTPVFLKLLVLSVIALTAIFLTLLFRNLPHKTERWMEIIQQRITPLIWLFGVWIVFSVPLVAYQTWGKETDKAALKRISQSSIVNRKRPNIILLTFDTLTARDMSVYGYHKPTTPFIAEWARAASLFTTVQAESNFTTPTVASLMTGKRVWTHQTYHLGGAKPDRSDIESLPLLLKNNGYYNMAFVVNGAASVETLGVSNSFEAAPISTEFRINVTLYDFVEAGLYRLFGHKIRLSDWIIKENFIMGELLNMVSKDVFKTRVPPEKAFNAFWEVLDKNSSEPFFAWIHITPPHYPYLPPKPYMGMMDSSPKFRTFKEQENIWGMAKEFPKKDRSDIDIIRDRYDEFIRYCDKQFEDFIAQLTRRNKLKNTVVILSSDHGESFEHNYLMHSGRHLYEQVTHIPLIIKEPGRSEGRVIDGLVEQIDIPSTILELARIPGPSWMEGRSLIPFMRGKKIKSRPAFSMNLETNRSRGHRITEGTIAVWEGDYKLIHYLKKKKSLLFNLKEDPDELNNLFDREPEVGQRLLALIQENLKKANERISKGE